MSRKLLVIDDDLICCRVMRAVFTAQGFEVLLAHDGRSGESVALRERPDVVLLDLHLPDSDGLTILRALLAMRPGLPVVFLTGHVEVKTAVRAIQLGAFDYVNKPIDLNDVVDVVDRALAKPRSEAEIASERLAAVIELQNAVAAAGLDFDGILRAVTHRASSLTRATGAVIELVEGDEMVYRAASGTLASHMDLRLKRSASLSGLCVEGRVPLRSDDAENDPRVDREACRRVGVASMICVPLLRDDDVMGVLKVVSAHRNAFNDGDLATLELLAQTIAVWMHHARAHQLAVHESVHDALTGLQNRRAFEQRLGEELGRHQREQRPLSLVMLDLDDFKTANDQLGHPAGDDILRQVGALLGRVMRGADLCFRLGGDEFALLLPNTSAAGAAVLIQRLAEEVVRVDLGGGIVGLSAGAAEADVSSGTERADQLMSRADQALYDAKREKKRRTQ